MSATHIDYETIISEEYLLDLNNVVDQKGLSAHCQKWKQLFKSMPKYQHWDIYRISRHQLTSWEEKPTDDKQTTLNIALPQELLFIRAIAREYGVPEGTVLLQLNQPHQGCVLTENNLEWIN